MLTEQEILDSVHGLARLEWLESEYHGCLAHVWHGSTPTGANVLLLKEYDDGKLFLSAEDEEQFGWHESRHATLESAFMAACTYMLTYAAECRALDLYRALAERAGIAVRREVHRP